MPFPADVVKSRIVSGAHGLPPTVPPTVLTVARHIYATAGVRGFYRGCGVTVCRAAPGNAILFLTYEHVHRLLR